MLTIGVMDLAKLIAFIKRSFYIEGLLYRRIEIDDIEFYKQTNVLVFNILKPRNYCISVSPLVYICFFSNSFVYTINIFCTYNLYLFLAGFIKLHLGLFLEFSLWYFNVINDCFWLYCSILSWKRYKNSN